MKKMKIKEEILKALKDELLKDDMSVCSECIADTDADFYVNIPSNKRIPEKMIYENKMTPCFYRFCCILKYYFDIDPKEVIKIYEKHGRLNELIFCKRYKFKKELQQEVYNLCLKYNNFNKI